MRAEATERLNQFRLHRTPQVCGGSRQHRFKDFIRHGGTSQFVVTRRDGRVLGRRVAFSIKSAFPHYAALRERFEKLLEQAQPAAGPDWIPEQELLAFNGFLAERGFGVLNGEVLVDCSPG